MTAGFWRKLALAVTALAAVGVLLAIMFLDAVVDFVLANEKFFRLVGLGIGPVAAVLAILWGLVDKAELRDATIGLAREKEKVDAAGREARAARQDVDAKLTRIAQLETDLHTIADSRRLWQLRENRPFIEYKGWKGDDQGAKIVTIGLFKGGVGKTHLAANLAAYVSEKQQKPVLIVDLDYQGSLSTIVLQAAAIEPAGSLVDDLLSNTADLATLTKSRLHLAQRVAASLNGGRGLSRAWIIPSDYTLAECESKLLVERVIHQRDSLDERYRLAHVLLNPDVRRQYAMIILDTPPRMTLGTVNALVASHCFVIPTILDKVSSEAVRPFLEQIKSLSTELDLNLQLAGVVAMMSRQLGLSEPESGVRDKIKSIVQEELGIDWDPMIAQHVPRKVQISNGEDLGYFLKDSDNRRLSDVFYDAIFDELWRRIHQGPTQIAEAQLADPST